MRSLFAHVSMYISYRLSEAWINYTGETLLVCNWERMAEQKYKCSRTVDIALLAVSDGKMKDPSSAPIVNADLWQVTVVSSLLPRHTPQLLKVRERAVELRRLQAFLYCHFYGSCVSVTKCVVELGGLTVRGRYDV